MRQKRYTKILAGALGVILSLFWGWQFTGEHNRQEGQIAEEDADVRETSLNQETVLKQETASGNVPAKDKRKTQQERTQSQSESTEAFSHKESEPVLDFASIQLMEAGTVLDVSRMEAGLTDSLFYSEEIGEKLQQRISGISYQENEHISLSELRYLRVLHMGFDGQTHIGELIVNASIAEDILEIMSELYKNSYPIEKMVLIDEYDAEDEPSMSDNNTSAFNYREIAGTSRISRHSFGVAIDINPRFNPYVKKMDSGETKISPANGAEYADRSQEFEHKIDERDLCYQLFTEHGFTWGGSWNSVKDYQHFEK